MIFGLLASLAGGLGDNLNRFLLHKRRITLFQFLTVSFTLFALLLAPSVLFLGDLSALVLTPLHISLVVVLALFTLAYSTFRNIGLQHLRIDIVEPLFLSSWIFTVLLGFVFFSDERNVVNLVLALIASAAIIFLNIKKTKFTFNRYTLLVLLSALLWALQAVVSKFLLESYDPVLLAFLRASLVAAMLLAFVRVRFTSYRHNLKYYIPLAIVDTAAIVFIFWSYQTIGIVKTTIVLSLYPLISEWIASIYLHERLRRKNMLATAVVVACIILSQLLGT